MEISNPGKRCPDCDDGVLKLEHTFATRTKTNQTCRCTCDANESHAMSRTLVYEEDYQELGWLLIDGSVDWAEADVVDDDQWEGDAEVLCPDCWRRNGSQERFLDYDSEGPVALEDKERWQVICDRCDLSKMVDPQEDFRLL